MKRTLCALMALTLIVMLSVSAQCELLEPSIDFYYNDTAGVLSRNAEAVIYFNSSDLSKACGAQIVIVTVDDLSGYTMKDYTVTLFNQWGVGDKEKNNGFVLAMLITDDPDTGNYYLCTGSGAGEIVSNSKAAELLDAYLEPYFAVGQYEEGVLSLYQALFETVRDYYGLNLAYLDYEAIENTYKLNSISLTTEGPKTAYAQGSVSGVFTLLAALFLIKLFLFGGVK